ncbi:unnamed protein product [Colias eurytheme]|nr:unnamed protein product [Colias eurytheme]
MRTLVLIYFATLVQCEFKSEVKHLRHARTLIRHGRSRVHFTRLHTRARDLVAQVIEAETSSELDVTKDLIKRRNELVNKKQLTSEEKQERSFLFKNIHKIIRKEYQDHRLTKIKKHLNTSRSVKKSLKELATTKKWIPSLNKKYDNKNTFCRNEILKEATEFYKDLYTCKTTSIIETPLTTNNKKLPRFTAQEISLRIKKLKNEKSMGPDNIPNEAISTGITLLTHPLTKLFNKILDERKIPTEWAKSDIILLYKKGDPNDLGNYRPISLQSNLYKLFASCLDKRLEKYTEEFQPVEQAGFRSKYSTIDHIHSLELIIEKYLEMHRPLYLAFIDYAKAFDSISHSSMWSALQECDVPTETIELIQDIYMKSKSKIILDRTGTEIDICRGVRQGDPLSPRIFISVLQNIMKTLKWETKGININGQFLSNLRFADDIVLFAESSSKLESMINEINYISNEIGLELNTTKTKIMTNSTKTPIHIKNVLLEYVPEYIYLGKRVSNILYQAKQIDAALTFD